MRENPFVPSPESTNYESADVLRAEIPEEKIEGVESPAVENSEDPTAEENIETLPFVGREIFDDFKKNNLSYLDKYKDLSEYSQLVDFLEILKKEGDQIDDTDHLEISRIADSMRSKYLEEVEREESHASESEQVIEVEGQVDSSTPENIPTPDSVASGPEKIEEVKEGQVEQQTIGKVEQQIEQREKTAVDISREKYAESDRKVRRLEKLVRSGSVDSRQLEQALEERASAEVVYMRANQERQAQFVRSLDGQSTEVKNEALRDMLFDTTIKEADRLYELKTNLALEEKGVGAGERIREQLVKAERSYAKLPRKTKLLIAGGMLAGAGAAAVLSGPVALGIAGIVGTARVARKALLGASVATATEAIAKNRQEKISNKKIEREFGGGVLESFQKGDVELYNALYKLESGKARQKTERYVLAGTLGTLAATFPFGKIISGALGESELLETIKDKIQGLRSAEVLRAESGTMAGVEVTRFANIPSGMIDDFGSGESPDVKIEPVAIDSELGDENVVEGSSVARNYADEFVMEHEPPQVGENVTALFPGELVEDYKGFESVEHIVSAGENMYSVIKEAIPELGTLPEAGQWNAIENILAEIKTDPTAFGIMSGDVNLLNVGDKINLEAIREVFETETIKGESIFDHAAKIAGVENVTAEDSFSVDQIAAISEQINTENANLENFTPEEIEQISEQVTMEGVAEKPLEELVQQNVQEEVIEGIELSELAETYKKLDGIFNNLTAKDVVHTTSGVSENFVGTLGGGEDFIVRQNSFNSLLSLIRSGEVSSGDFVSYFSEKGIRLNEHSLARDFENIANPELRQFARHSVNRLELTFNSLILKLSN